MTLQDLARAAAERAIGPNHDCNVSGGRCRQCRKIEIIADAMVVLAREFAEQCLRRISSTHYDFDRDVYVSGPHHQRVDKDRVEAERMANDSIKAIVQVTAAAIMAAEKGET